ncbi:replication initiator protein [Microviridae sp.]|nr:replication initiator protein [Microviridae sp.]
MACFHPLHGYYSRSEFTKTGKRKVIFNRSEAYEDKKITLPCGQCTGCRLERSRQWAIRCLHESQLHEKNCFITLTYSDDHLPTDGSLNHGHWVLFAKRLRKKYGKGIRYYMCGEYGEQFARPHYHACLFNHDFEDKLQFSERDGIPLYQSEALNKLWSTPYGDPLGFASVGDVTFQSAAYVARYIMKKITGEKAEEHYTHLDQHGEIHERTPEYTQMSRRPGIGADWLKKYQADVYPSDFVVLNGKKCKPPKFYDRSYEVVDPDQLQKLKARRNTGARKNAPDNTPERLRVREKCLNARLNQLKRNL